MPFIERQEQFSRYSKNFRMTINIIKLLIDGSMHMFFFIYQFQNYISPNVDNFYISKQKMNVENLLDESQTEKSEFTNCKIKYLTIQNKLMMCQLNSVGSLVEKYKKIIDIISLQNNQNCGENSQVINQPDYDEQNKQNIQYNPKGSSPPIVDNRQIKKILRQAEEVIQNCAKQCRDLTTNNNIFEEEEGTITPAFFSQVVLSYEKTIAQLKHNIHQRQLLLQELEVTPVHPMKRKNQEQPQSANIIKAIESYDIYPKLSEKCRKEILELKRKKKQLEMIDLTNKNSGKLKYLNKNTNGLNQFDKTIKKVPQYINAPLSEINFDEKTQINTQAMSPFEKTILIYKKKKIFNDILEAKVIDLKKKIKEKQLCNQILRKKLENEVWNNLQNINHYGKNLDDDDPAYLSILSQSIRANNLDFSVDISRVINGGHTKHENPVNLENILEEVGRETEREKQFDGK